MEKYNIITVINGVSPTSMPLNEFLTYRKDNFGENGSVMTLSKFDNKKHKKFSNLNVISFNNNPKAFIKFIWFNSNMIFHLHQQHCFHLIIYMEIDWLVQILR